MIKNLGARLACRGKIKIGGLGEKRKSQAGKEYRMPMKYDHFVITTNARSKDGDLIMDNELMQKLGNRTDLDVMLFGGSIEDCYDDWYAYYDGKKAICRGNGELAIWKGDKNVYKSLYGQLEAVANENMPATTVKCAGDACPLFKKEDDKTGCKLNFILRVILMDAPAVGGVYELRSTSINSALAMRASIGMLLNITGGQITGVPLKLKLSPKTVSITSGQSTIYVTHLEYQGSVIELKRSSIEQQKQVLMLDHSLVNAKNYQEWEDEQPDEIAAVSQEFNPVEPEPEIKKSRLESIVDAQSVAPLDVPVVPDVVDMATGEVLTPETATTKNYDFLRVMREMKTVLGDEYYYGILKENGYEHSNKIVDRKTQEDVYNKMKQFLGAMNELEAGK